MWHLLPSHLFSADLSIVELIDGKGCGGHSSMGYGGLVVWTLLTVYLFVGLYVLCEEYFVPSLTVLGEKLGLSEDVCGATLMAAGSSSPEFFTAMIGVFFYAKENPGPSTNCASAAFNMCVIIGMSILLCGLTRTPIQGYPFVRDSVVYALSTVWLYLIYEVITPGRIDMWESAVLVVIYTGYVVALYRQAFVVKMIIRGLQGLGMEPPRSLLYHQMDPMQAKHHAAGHKAGGPLSADDMSFRDIRYYTDDGHGYEDIKLGKLKQTESEGSSEQDGAASPRSAEDKNATLLPTEEDAPEFQGTHDAAVLSIQKELSAEAEQKQDMNPTQVEAAGMPSPKFAVSREPPHTLRVKTRPPSIELTTDFGMKTTGHSAYSRASIQSFWNRVAHESTRELREHALLPGYKRAFYYSLVPFRFMFALTIPRLKSMNPDDVTMCRLNGIFFVVILWLAFMTYICVDCANKIGSCSGLTPEVMGLTVLAIGSSLPDCFSSILVAKDGKMTMAVSNALGSNIFDICICVGLSFFIKSLQEAGGRIKVETTVGYEAFIVALFILLALLVVMMYRSNMTLSRRHGYVLLAAYAVFLMTFAVVLDFSI